MGNKNDSRGYERAYMYSVVISSSDGYSTSVLRTIIGFPTKQEALDYADKFNVEQDSVESCSDWCAYANVVEMYFKNSKEEFLETLKSSLNMDKLERVKTDKKPLKRLLDFIINKEV